MSRRTPQATIPEPYTDVVSLRASVMALKELVEDLAGQRGDQDTSAVTWSDMRTALGTGVGSKVSKTGDTMTGDLIVNGAISNSGSLTCGSFVTSGQWTAYQLAGGIGQGGQGSVMIQQNNSGSQAFFTLHISGVFAGNYGIDGGGSFYMGGWSYGANTYRFWTTRDFTNNPSDYRVKKDVTDLPGMWDTVKRLRPVRYTHQDFTPPNLLDSWEKSGHTPDKPYFAGDDIERWGFIAHELQETLIDDAANCPKDDPDLIQAPNAFVLLAAVVKALQEAMTRIEALEANG
jgi:hypothetical protein